jgi:monolysocardiolipin acyltransferase
MPRVNDDTADAARTSMASTSSPSSSSPLPEYLPTDPPWGTFGRQAVLSSVALFSKFILDVVNTTTTTNLNVFEDAISKRNPDRGLITVCNHVSTFDDPGMLSALIPWSFFATEPWHRGVRWTLCTDEICAKNKTREDFFLCGKALAIKRGGGVDQPAMRTAARLVKDGEWVHIFPEGRVSRDGEIGRMRWGLAKLLCDVELAGGKTPDILPFVHSGMNQVKTYGKWGLGVGNRVHVTVGQPLDVSDLTAKCRRCEKNAKARDALYASIMARVDQSLRDLEAKNIRERRGA